MSNGSDAFDFDPPMKRDDEANARRWRGQLFRGLRSPLTWRDKWKGHYENLHRPQSVTFPICAICGHIVWEWPHFEEEIPHNAICDICFRKEQEAQERDWE